jgi:hypothetical protein
MEHKKSPAVWDFPFPQVSLSPKTTLKPSIAIFFIFANMKPDICNV